MILRPESPESPFGPPMTNRPVGLTRCRVSPSSSSAGMAASTTWVANGRGQLGSISTSGSCCALTRTVCTAGRPVGVVLNRDLALAVGSEERQRAVAAHLGQAPRDAVRKQDRHRHELVRLVGRVAEHHSLVAGAELVRLHALARLERVIDAAGDVRETAP